MISLYQFARTWGIPNLGHFCVKVETYLRMVKLPYEIVTTLPLKAPLGKLPYIEDNGYKVADSRSILRYLPPPPVVSVVQPIAREVIEWDEYIGRLESPETVEIRARVSGYLDKVHFKEGKEVKKGASAQRLR